MQTNLRIERFRKQIISFIADRLPIVYNHTFSLNILRAQDEIARVLVLMLVIVRVFKRIIRLQFAACILMQN